MKWNVLPVMVMPRGATIVGLPRSMLADRRGLALLLACLLLLPRLIVPAGFMPMTAGGHVSIVPCSGFGPMAMAGTPGRPGTPHDHRDDGKADPAPCPFAALAQPATGGAPPVLLPAAVAFILALGFVAAPAPAPATPARLRPPLRAPPR